MLSFREVQSHGEIKAISPFDNIYMVTGTNINKEYHIQASRNMVIIRDEEGMLTLINTVRLNEKELAHLDTLGTVKNIVRLGAFHGYDDAFYLLDRYKGALFWALDGVKDLAPYLSVNEILKENHLPLKNCRFFQFEKESACDPEGILVLGTQQGDVLITCDSVQNWTLPKDEFTSEETFKSFQKDGSVGIANIPPTWLKGYQPKKQSLETLEALDFQHLISAHGEPLLHEAHERVCDTLRRLKI